MSNTTQPYPIDSNEESAEDDSALRYPLGKYRPVNDPSDQQLNDYIGDIAALPEQLRRAVEGLEKVQLLTPYRPGGWTVKQLVHHIGDSHLNSIIRFKWTLTEDNPTIKAYSQVDWAETPDVPSTSVETNLRFIEALHKKWVSLLGSLSTADWKKTFVHPETGKQISLSWLVGLYAWHGKHHVAHIVKLRERKGWN